MDLDSEYSMGCIAPPELDERQLTAYLDAAADNQALQHIARCPYCREKARKLAAWQERLQARLYRSNCPPSLELGEYQLGLLSRARAVPIAKHVVECPHCALELAQLHSFMRDEMEEPERSTLQRAADVLQGQLHDLVRVLTGQVVGRQPGLAAVRGSAREPIMIEADGMHVILDVQPVAEGRATILGQLAADGIEHWAGAEVDLWQAGEPQRTTSIDDIGTFRFEGVLPHTAELLITSPGGSAISVPNLDITL